MRRPIETENNRASRRPGRAGRIAAAAILAIVLLGAVIGTVATQALARGPGGWGPSFMGGGADGPMDPARMAEHVGRAVKHFCVETDCTPEQQGRLVGIAQDAAKDMSGIRGEMRSARQRAMLLLSAPTIDREAIERLRAEQAQKLDEASRRAVQAMADAAEVLTPAQRQQVGQRMEQWHQHRWFRPRG